MSSSRGRVLAIARHEYRAATRSRALITLVGVLVVVTVVSVYVAAVEYRSQLADYQAYVEAATASGVPRVAPSPLALLSLLRGAIEYIEIIGAVVAIALGYLSVSRERASRTLALIRSRPVTSGELAAGSVLGALAMISTLVAVSAVAAVLCLGLIGNDWVGGDQPVKLLLAYVASTLYMLAFFCLGALVTARARVASNGLIVALGLWLGVVLVLPQIGDTLDADNQVPGGLFSALTLDKPQEDQILARLGVYERLRTGIEAASFAKHYERLAFAMTDVKDRYRGMSLGQLLRVERNDMAWISFYSLALGYGVARSFRGQPTISQEGVS